jgi:excisionase family DNA binding protein
MPAKEGHMTGSHFDRNAVRQVDLAARAARPNKLDGGLDELLTVNDVATLLKVSRSWVYEHTRSRAPHMDRLPFVKIGEYVRFQSRAVLDFLAKRSRVM